MALVNMDERPFAASTLASGRLTGRTDARRLLAAYFALRGILLPLMMPVTVPAMMVFVVTFGLLGAACAATLHGRHNLDGALRPRDGIIEVDHNVGPVGSASL